MARILSKFKKYDLKKTFASDDSTRIYSQNAADSLLLWIDLAATTVTDKTLNTNPVYSNPPDQSGTTLLGLGDTVQKYVLFEDASNNEIEIGNSPNESEADLFNFSKLTPDGLGSPYAGSDNPFSVSMWVKVKTSGTNNTLFSKSDGVFNQYHAYLDSSNAIQFSIWDSSTLGYRYIVSYAPLTENVWYHLAFTYDGRGGDDAQKGLKVYINGHLDTSTLESKHGTFLGFTPNTKKKFRIAANYAGNNEFDGYFSEIAVWNTILTLDDIYSIYSRTSNSLVKSGFSNNPERTLLFDSDNATGSYPTNPRILDPDFTGNYKTFYDDTNTINFVSNNLVYPMSLPASSKWVSGGIATPNILQGLVAPGASSAGIADTHVSFTPGQNISPFKENRIYVDADLGYYQTGTDESILPGFDQKLSSKTVLTFDTSPTETTRICWTTGSEGRPGVVANSGLSYFNWVDKKWEIIGDLSNKDNVDYANSDPDIVAGSMLAVVPASYWKGEFNPVDAEVFNSALGLPSDVAGFPFSNKFNPTVSQVLSLKNSLTEPFLVEKISLSFSATLGTNGFFTLPGEMGQPANLTFMLLLQRDKSANGNPTSQIISIGTPVNSLLSGNTTEFTQNQDRRIIWTGRVGKFLNFSMEGNKTFTSESDLAEKYPATYSSCDAWIPMKSQNFSQGITGTFSVSAPCKNFGKYPTVTYFYLTRNNSINPAGEIRIFGNSNSNRDLQSLLDGRSFSAAVSGNKTAANIFEPLERISPFVLLPGDKLILACANQQYPTVNSTRLDENILDYVKCDISPGESQLTLFGSQLRNNKQKSFELNHPLTSDAIHEDLHDTGNVFDQFDVEPRLTYTGSYIDRIVTGSMVTLNNTGRLQIASEATFRRVQATVTAGQGYGTGSLQRFVGLSDSSNSYYDSFVPDYTEFGKNIGVGFFKNDVDVITLFDPGTTKLGGASVDTWYKYFVFEKSIDRQVNSNIVASSQGTLYDFFDVVISEGFASQVASASYSPSTLLVKGRGGESSGPENLVGVKRFLWGFGDGEPGFSDDLLKFGNPGFDSNSFPIIRGSRYGLLNVVPQSPKNIFRRDRYGQFRDMLEQSFDSTILENRGGFNSAVKIKFISRPNRDGTGAEFVEPSQTHSQNLSPFSTSSIPYFDGLCVDRTDNPDLVLDSYVSLV